MAPEPERNHYTAEEIVSYFKIYQKLVTSYNFARNLSCDPDADYTGAYKIFKQAVSEFREKVPEDITRLLEPDIQRFKRNLPPIYN